jgi:hypothetical protein
VQLARKLGIENLLPLLRQGSTGLKELEDRARSLGLVLSNETVQGLADAQRQMELASQQIKTNLTGAFSGLATAIAQATGLLADFLIKMRLVGEASPRTGAMLRGLFLGIISPGANIGSAIGGLTDRGGLPTKSADQLAAEMRPIFGRKPAGGFAPTFQGEGAKGTRSPKGTKADPLHVEAPEPVGRTDDPGLALLREFEANRELTRRAERRTSEAVDGFEASDLEVFKNGPTDWINKAAQAAIDAADEAQKAYENSVHQGVLDGLRAAADGNGLDFLKNRLREAMFEAAADALTKAFLTAQANSGGGFGGTILKGIGAFLGFNAGGTDNWRGGLSVVGERGPELVNLPRGAQVIPNNVLRGMGGATGSGTTVLNQFDMRGSIVEDALYKRVQTIARTEANRAGAKSASFTLGAMPGRLVQQQKLGR